MMIRKEGLLRNEKIAIEKRQIIKHPYPIRRVFF
jgi:hypothetical protein